jgi:hypothetical protein
LIETWGDGVDWGVSVSPDHFRIPFRKSIDDKLPRVAQRCPVSPVSS